jgi:hypothetical protein
MGVDEGGKEGKRGGGLKRDWLLRSVQPTRLRRSRRAQFWTGSFVVLRLTSMVGSLGWEGSRSSGITRSTLVRSTRLYSVSGWACRGRGSWGWTGSHQPHRVR